MEVKKVGFTDEQKKLLKKSIAFKPRAEFLYVPKAFRVKKDGEYAIPRDQWTVFKLRGLMGIATTEVGYEMYDVEWDGAQVKGVKINSARAKISVCKRGIIDVKNLYNEDFEVVKFSGRDQLTGRLPDSDIDLMPPDLIEEIYGAIVENSTLTNEELLGLEF